jgi:hypothetical protein
MKSRFARGRFRVASKGNVGLRTCRCFFRFFPASALIARARPINAQEVGKRFLLRFKEKGGKEKELPVHHKLEELREHFIFACVSMRHNRLFDPFMAPEEAYHEALSRISLFATEKKSRDIIVLLLE